MDKKKKSPLKIVFTVLVAIACVVSVVLVGARCYFRIPVRDYYSISEKTFVIPDCDNGFIAQGIAYDEANEVFFVTGYMKDGSASPIYLVERTDKDNTPESTDTSAESTTETEESRSLSKRVRMIANNGEDLCCHAVGICIKGAYVFIAGGSDHCLYAFSYDEILNADNGAKIKSLGDFPLYMSDNDCLSPAFLTTDEDHVYVGEFYREGNYPTPESHHLESGIGEESHALCFSFKTGSGKGTVFGLELTPDAAYTLPDLAQGMAFNDNKVYVSTSWGAAKSHIYSYDALGLSSGTITVLNTEVPLYYLDSSSLLDVMDIAPMSEEIEFVDSKMYTMCESASDKYIFGKFTSAQYCWATDFSKK